MSAGWTRLWRKLLGLRRREEPKATRPVPVGVLAWREFGRCGAGCKETARQAKTLAAFADSINGLWPEGWDGSQNGWSWDDFPRNLAHVCAEVMEKMGVSELDLPPYQISLARNFFCADRYAHAVQFRVNGRTLDFRDMDQETTIAAVSSIANLVLAELALHVSERADMPDDRQRRARELIASLPSSDKLVMDRLVKL